MQRQEPQGVVISCDFCGTDWDQMLPMIEGHRGSVLCLQCLKRALDEQRDDGGPFQCTLCLRELDARSTRWCPVDLGAVACADCINQAAGTFSKDPDVDWKRP